MATFQDRIDIANQLYVAEAALSRAHLALLKARKLAQDSQGLPVDSDRLAECGDSLLQMIDRMVYEAAQLTRPPMGMGPLFDQAPREAPIEGEVVGESAEEGQPAEDPEPLALAEGEIAGEPDAEAAEAGDSNGQDHAQAEETASPPVEAGR